eukprot:TRINITY_DN10452_c0_g1_i1.p1 TRINITY_DN10452_c0_g1~~TRINITY_DN10452_c0_g1_i1.p1  ORF type:complete len:911 (+),score=214.49 TRINITY_DN10452_c0_g1_i1:33-2765(+)
MTSKVERAFHYFKNHNYADSIHTFDDLIHENKLPIYYLNRAAAYFSLDLYRLCIKDCDAAIKLDSNLEKGYLLKGYAYQKIGKNNLALSTWKEGLKIYRDIDTFLELDRLVNGTHSNPQHKISTSSKNTPKATTIPSVFSKSKRPQEEPRTSPLTDENDRLEFTKPSKSVPKIDSETFEALASHTPGLQIQHGSGEPMVDKKIAYGFYQVNSGALQEGIKVFDELLIKHPTLVAAYLGRGTALALAGQLKEAAHDFSKAIECDPKCVDAYKRRGQTRAANGYESEAMSDFDTAIVMAPDSEAYLQRGLLHYRKKNYKRAVADFESAAKLDHHNDPTMWNHIGLCYNSMGDCQSSIEAHTKAISLRPNFKESIVNLGQAYKDWGKFDEAIRHFNKGLEMDPNYVHGLHLRGLAYFSVGRHIKAIEDLEKAIKLTHTPVVDTIIMCAVAKNGCGRLRDAIMDYDRALSLDPFNPCWYQKQIALWWHHRLDAPIDDINMDLDLEPQFKEFWCKRLNPRLLKSYKPQPAINTKIPDIKPTTTTDDLVLKKVLEYSYFFGRQLHQDAPGYMSNKRQQRMAGLAIVDIAQRLRDYWFNGNDKIVASKLSTSSKGDDKVFGWRTIFDVAVRWRQYSEPNDPVWWVDLLTPEQFAEGFGSHTPMITGQCNVVRYSPMFHLSFPIMKEELIKQKNLSEKLKQQVRDAKTCNDLYQIMKQDFWIVTPCYSIRTGKIMEGTRLTLQKSEPEGFEYSIRTPGTPPRWVDYDLEMKHIFDLLTKEVRKPDYDLDKVSELILTVTFFWYNFMPLSRGTAACGYIALIAMFLAIGIEITNMVPTNFLVDWQGILRPKAELFNAQIKPWLFPARTKTDMKEFESIPSLAKMFPTIRSIITALNLEYTGREPVQLGTVEQILSKQKM